MKTREIRRLHARYLAAAFPELQLEGTLLLHPPIHYLLRGCHFESSSYSKSSVAVHAFVQPLYVPSTVLWLSFGKRLAGSDGRWWEMAERGEDVIMEEITNVIRREAIPLFQKLSTPGGFARSAEEFFGPAKDVSSLEAIAYSNFLSGNLPLASKQLEQLSREIEQLEPDVEWLMEMQQRVELIASELSRNPNRVRKQLNTWRDETLEALGLVHIATPMPE